MNKSAKRKVYQVTTTSQLQEDSGIQRGGRYVELAEYAMSS